VDLYYNTSGFGVPSARYCFSFVSLLNQSFILFGGDATNVLWMLITCDCYFGSCDLTHSSCNECFPNFFGKFCKEKCTCINGNCSEGINGNGFCLSCIPKFFGPNCDQICIDTNCTILCYSDEPKTCKNNITILQIKFSFNSSIMFQGNTLIEESNFGLINSQLLFQKDIDIFNSTILFNSSSIISEGCINLTDTNISIDLTNINSNQDQLLLNSTAGCLLLGNTLKLTYVNQPSCTTVQKYIDSYALIIVLKETNCNDSLLIWVVIVIAIIFGLTLILSVIVLVIPSLRRKIFPFVRKRKERIVL